MEPNLYDCEYLRQINQEGNWTYAERPMTTSPDHHKKQDLQ